MIRQLQSMFHSITKSLEVLYVIEGAKQCSRMMVHEDELGKAAEFFGKHDLKYSVSDFKGIKQKSSEFYSESSIKMPKNSELKGHFFVYLSKDKEMAARAKVLEEKNDHRQLGLLLGYPECCCDFFQAKFNEKNPDLTLDALSNSEGFKFPFHTNIAARHFDVTLLSYFPHSFSCSPSIEIAKKNLKVIEKNSENLAKIFAGLLKTAVIYASQEGFFLLRGHQLKDKELYFNEVLTTTKSKLYYLLNEAKHGTIENKNSFKVGDEKFEGKDYGIMIFE